MSTEGAKANQSDRPAGWPDKVDIITLGSLNLLGVHKDTGELYWDGRKVIVQRPITLGVFERVLASGAAVSALGVMIVEVGRSAGWWGG